jgi:hypothetical protein
MPSAGRPSPSADPLGPIGPSIPARAGETMSDFKSKIQSFKIIDFELSVLLNILNFLF